MNDYIPELKIELDDGSGDGLILLEQDCGGNVDRVAIHLVHLRYMAEKCGLIATSDPTAQRTIATLARRLVLLRDRIDHLGSYLANHSDHRHADLSYECAPMRQPPPTLQRSSAPIWITSPPWDIPHRAHLRKFRR
jgi:hypothetical protein